MKFSLEYLEAFDAAAETGSFSAAARKQGKAQSRISTAIANLEIDLGLTLFDRSRKYPTLTPAGERLLKLARDIINRCKGLSEQANLLAEGEQPLLSVAVDDLIPSKLLAKIFENFGHAFPETDLEIFMGVMGDVGEMVKSGRAHVGIELPTGTPTAGCNWRLLGRMNFMMVTASSHPLARMKHISPEDLAPYRQLVTVSRGGHREPESFLFGDRCWMCENSQMIRDLVLRGQGWGELAHYQVAGDLAAGLLVRLPVTSGKELNSSDICLVWKKGSTLSRTSEWLGNALENALTDRKMP